VSPLSRDPERRAAQLANLRPGKAPEGNRRALSHGGYGRLDEGRLASKRRELFEMLADDAPLRDEAGGLPRHDQLAVSLLAETLTRLESVRVYLDMHGQLDGKGRERPAVTIEDRLIGRAEDLAESLGMTPRSRAKLGVDTARGMSLADEIAAAQQARERRGGDTA